MSITIQNREDIAYGFQVEMVTVVCYKCSIPFAMPERLNEWLRRSQEGFYCPNGHSQAYTKSTEQIFREKMENQKRDYERALDGVNNNLKWTREQRDKAIRERSAVKGQLTKLKNRVKNGVCPCCNRTFSNLANHIKNQHPDYTTTE